MQVSSKNNTTLDLNYRDLPTAERPTPVQFQSEIERTCKKVEDLTIRFLWYSFGDKTPDKCLARLKNFSNLKRLTLKSSSVTGKTFPQLPESLEELTLQDCGSVLPESLKCLYERFVDVHVLWKYLRPRKPASVEHSEEHKEPLKKPLSDDEAYAQQLGQKEGDQEKIMESFNQAHLKRKRSRALQQGKKHFRQEEPSAPQAAQIQPPQAVAVQQAPQNPPELPPPPYDAVSAPQEKKP